MSDVTSENDAVNRPRHYRHPSGVEAIEICEHLDFCLGNALKYLFRVGKKHGVVASEDLQKSAWYLRRAVENRQLGYNLLIRTAPNLASLTKLIESEPEGSVLRDVLELLVQRYALQREPRIADALLRVERELEQVTNA